MSIIRAIKKFLKPVKAQTKQPWVHLNGKAVIITKRYESDSDTFNYNCRYKVVEGRTDKKTIQKDLQATRVRLTPKTEKAVVLVWKWDTPFGHRDDYPPARYVVHLDKKGKGQTQIGPGP